MYLYSVMMIIDFLVYGLISIIVVGKSYSKVGLKYSKDNVTDASPTDSGSITESNISHSSIPRIGQTVSLRLLNVSKNYLSREGAITVLNSVNAELMSGCVTCLLGSNGAGKVSAINTSNQKAI